MKLYIAEDDTTQLKDLMRPHERISTNHFKFTVIHHKDKYLIRTSSEVVVDRTILSTEEFIHVNDSNGNYCMLLLIEDGDGYNTYQKYQLTKEISIGSGYLCDICINHVLLDIENIKIDPNRKMIYLKQRNVLCSLNSKIINEDISYTFSDTLLIGGERILFFEDGIMMNCNKEVTVHLPIFTLESLNLKISIPQKKVRKYNQIPNIQFTFNYRYKTYSQSKNDLFRQPLLLMIGPSLFMSVASIFVGLLSVYNAYLNERDMLSVLPTILLPSVMLISTLLFQPLNKRFEIKYEKEQLLKRQKEDSDNKKAIEYEYFDFIQKYKQLTNTFYPDTEELIQQIENCECCYTQTKDKAVVLRVGEKKDILNCENLDSSLNKDALELNCTEPLAWLIHLDTYKMINIITLNHFEEVFRFIILQLTFRYEKKVMILAEDSFINENKWILSMNNIIDRDRLLITEHPDKIIQKTHANEHYIIISMNKEIPKIENMSMISFNSSSYENIDLILNYDSLSYYDYIKCEGGKFYFEFCPIHEIDKYLFLLRNQELKYIENDIFSIHSISRISKELIKEKWLFNHIDQGLCALIGIDECNQIIQLDLNENKDGPHGLIAGTTGSGKTELLLSMILSIALNYSYEEVQFVYIDFKGGGGVNTLKGLPHLIGTLTNLQYDTIERALVSFQNECKYREECISKMNKLSESTIMNINDYRSHYQLGFDLPKLPDLVIVVDEFAELKRLYPDFLSDLISISRIGRSLGIHLILCTQKPAGSISEDIWSNCTFKICLKVNEKRDSQEVIHSNDAYELNKAGEFVFLSNRQYKKGLGTFSNARIELGKHEFNYVKNDGTFVPINLNQHTIPQIKKIMYEMKKINNLNARKLWLDEILPLTWDESIEEGMIGIVDDYYDRKQYGLKLFREHTRNAIFITNILEERYAMIRLILATMIHGFHNANLFVIDDLNLNLSELFATYHRWIELMDSDDHEKILNTLKYLNNNKEESNVLVITDISRFYDADNQFKIILRKLLEQVAILHLKVILFASSASVVSYRDLSYISNRILLKTDSIQEVQQLFETNEKMIVNEAEWGMVKNKRLLKFRYYSITYDELRHLFLKESQGKENSKKIKIPSMPKSLNRTSCDLSLIPIGISYRNYEWIKILPTSSIYVVSLYKDELLDYYKIMKTYAKCTFIDSVDMYDGQLIFLSLDEYRHLNSQKLPVLYIGESYKHQFVFHSKIKSLNADQGILFHQLESELLKIL